MYKAACLATVLVFGILLSRGLSLASISAPGPAIPPPAVPASAGQPANESPVLNSSGKAVGVATVWDRIMEEASLTNLRKGYMLMEAENYPEAANEFLKAIARTPAEPYARILYGSSLYWLGSPDKAMAEFETAAALDPRNPVAYQLMGIVHAWKGEFAPALEKFIKARDLAPDRADVRMNIGSIYQSLGDTDKALDYCRAAARLEPKNPLYLYQLGLIYSRLGRVPEGKAAFRGALSAFRDYEDAMLELAVLEEKDGNIKEAVRLYRKALGIKPGDNVARFRLGCLLYKTGDDKRLNALLEDAFLLTPSNAAGGISVSLAYAGGPDAENPRPGAGKSSGAEPGRDNPGSLESAVARVPADEDISIKAELISIPKTRLAVRPEGAPKGLKDALEAGLNRPKVGYLRREYSLPASDVKNRGARAARIASELDSAVKAASGQDLDTRVSISLETRKASVSPAAGGASPNVVYKPRDVGNDMGLWVMGANWLENVEDALEDLQDVSGGPGKDGRFGIVLGLGRLILGEPDAALSAFESVPSGAAADLGRCAAWVEKGAQDKALSACLDALKKEPQNKTVLANLKWLKRTVTSE